MDSDLTDVETLIFCAFCKQKFNATDLCPKILQCKHHFCLKCIETTMVKGQELFCVHCWKRTEVNDGGARLLPTNTAILALANHLTTVMLNENKLGSNGCSTHGQTITLWCHTCHLPLCRLCYLLIEHAGHHVTSDTDARDLLYSELELASVQKLFQDIQRLSTHQREFQLKVLEACVTLKACIESELTLGSSNGNDLGEAKDLLLRARAGILPLSAPADLQASFTTVMQEKQRLKNRYHDLVNQCKMDELIGSSGIVFDFPMLATLQQSNDMKQSNLPLGPASILLLANFCIYQLYTRCLTNNKSISPPITILRNPPTNIHPQYYFIIDLNQVPIGRFVIETRPDLAPKMARNFGALCLGETGPSYKHCSIFQCWEGESIITGDYESNNGRGGRSIYEDGYFMPDETKMAAVRGAVGMRRTQKRHDNLGLVGSQFRVILQEMRGFTAIFGHVIEGIDIVEKIASCGDQTGKPTKNIVITSCGKL